MYDAISVPGPPSENGVLSVVSTGSLGVLPAGHGPEGESIFDLGSRMGLEENNGIDRWQ